MYAAVPRSQQPNFHELNRAIERFGNIYSLRQVGEDFAKLSRAASIFHRGINLVRKVLHN